MPITTIWSKIEGLHIALIPNMPQEQEGGATFYVPWTLRVTGVIETANGGRKPHQAQKDLGSAWVSPLTEKQLYQAAPEQVKAILKQFILEAIGEDVEE